MLPGRAPGGGRIELRPSRLAQGPDLRCAVRGLSRAQGHRESGGDDLAERMVVVVGGPAQQLQSNRIEDRSVVQDVVGRFELRSGHGRDLGDAGEHADQLAAAERHLHPHPGSGGPSGGVGRQVIEGAAQRRVERNLQDQGDPFVHISCG